MRLSEGRYRWNGSQLLSVEAPELALFVADSFLVRDGHIVAANAHQARFLRDCETQGMVNSPTAFLSTAYASLPRDGLWFPRIDLTERGELELWVRPSPPLGRTVTLWTSPTDPRATPRIKGPDIPALAALRDTAKDAGADEAVILDADGYVCDGATTCFAWWRGDTLCLPPTTSPRVDSVTVAVVRSLAEEAGYEVRDESVTPDDLTGTDLWALNSLHGIRGVTEWISGPILSVNEARLDTWRQTYRNRAERVSKGH